MSSSPPNSSPSGETQSLKISTSTRNSSYSYAKPPRNSFAESSSIPLTIPGSSQQYSSRSTRKHTLTNLEYDCLRQPKKVPLFKNQKAKPEEDGVWPTGKDVLFTLIMSAGIVMVIGEILELLASIYLTQQLGFFSSVEFWRRWKVCMRLLVVALWLGKLAFDAGIALGKADAQRKLDRPLGISFRSPL